jgi:hypothetical protein
MADSATRCSYCGKQRAVLKRCSVCKQASYCGAECQHAGWKKHKKTCAPPLSTQDVWDKVEAADTARDWRGVLEWEGRMEELMEGQSDGTRDAILGIFIRAHCGLGLAGLDSEKHELSEARLMEQRIALLGQMKRFRDQGGAMCRLASSLDRLDRKHDAAQQYERARAVGAAHGFFSVECSACRGLGEMAMQDGRHEEGVELLQNALVAARLGEDEDSNQELAVLCTLIDALFVTDAIDELDPLVLRYREMAHAESRNRGGRVCYFVVSSLVYSARLHEVLRFCPPYRGASLIRNTHPPRITICP